MAWQSRLLIVCRGFHLAHFAFWPNCFLGSVLQTSCLLLSQYHISVSDSLLQPSLAMHVLMSEHGTEVIIKHFSLICFSFLLYTVFAWIVVCCLPCTGKHHKSVDILSQVQQARVTIQQQMSDVSQHTANKVFIL